MIERIREFDGARGILALWVLLYHVALQLGIDVHPAIAGPQAVTVFFCLSGFVISECYGVRPSASRHSLVDDSCDYTPHTLFVC